MNTIGPVNSINSKNSNKQGFGMKFNSLESVPKALLSEFKEIERQPSTSHFQGKIEQIVKNGRIKLALILSDTRRPEEVPVVIFNRGAKYSDTVGGNGNKKSFFSFLKQEPKSKEQASIALYQKLLSLLNDDKGNTVVLKYWLSPYIKDAFTDPKYQMMISDINH
jgi:hypothetical protein